MSPIWFKSTKTKIGYNKKKLKDSHTYKKIKNDLKKTFKKKNQQKSEKINNL